MENELIQTEEMAEEENEEENEEDVHEISKILFGTLLSIVRSTRKKRMGVEGLRHLKKK